MAEDGSVPPGLVGQASKAIRTKAVSSDTADCFPIIASRFRRLHAGGVVGCLRATYVYVAS